MNMMERFLEIIKDLINKNHFLSQNLNSYYTMQKNCKIVYPAIGIVNFKQKCVPVLQNCIFAREISFSLIVESDDSAGQLIAKISDNIENILNCVSHIDLQNNLDIKFSIVGIDREEKNSIQKIIYQFEGIAFYKIKLFE